MPDSTREERYRATVRELSDRLVEAQRPIRVLDAIQWDGGVREAFFAAGFRELPRVDRETYARRVLGFAPEVKRREFQELARDVVRRLGQFNPVGGILRRMCREYEQVIRLLEARGTPEFTLLSQELYGSAGDVFHAGEPTLAELGVGMSEALTRVDRSEVLREEPKSFDGAAAVGWLDARLREAFGAAGGNVRVVLGDGILADAAAGSDYLKIRKDARFTERDLRILEVHEGWVHLGTTLNGQRQPWCTFLAKGPPSVTVTQEGLAMLMELVSLASHPARLRRITNRIRAVDMAERGADFLDVFRFFAEEEGVSPEEAWQSSVRVFRGSAPRLGPFTKDIAYSKGFVLTWHAIQLAVRKGLLDRIPLLFCGKVTLEDLGLLAQLADEGLVKRPDYLPPPIADLNALVAWMCCASFLGHLDGARIEADYQRIL